MTSHLKESYQHVIIDGLPFTRGKSYGEQVKSKIISNINYYVGVLPPWDHVKKFIVDHYLNAIKKYFPSGFEEMKGIAEGAGVTLEEIILLNARYDLQRWQRQLNIEEKQTQNEAFANECTGAVCLPKATKHGDVLLALNWDINHRILNEDLAILLEVHPDESENIAPFFMLTEAGQLGRSGMNANGLGIIAMGLWSSEDHFKAKSNASYVPVSLLRRMFIEAPTFNTGMKRILSAPRHVSVNMIIATGEGEGINIELTPNQYFISHPDIERDLFVHSNHFKSQQFLAKDSIVEGSRGSSSLYRDRQLEKGLLSHWGKIDENNTIDCFKNHLGFPESLCFHTPPPGKEFTSSLPNDCTVACIVYNLSKKTLKVCKGQPCVATFIEYKLSQ